MVPIACKWTEASMYRFYLLSVAQFAILDDVTTVAAVDLRRMIVSLFIMQNYELPD